MNFLKDGLKQQGKWWTTKCRIIKCRIIKYLMVLDNFCFSIDSNKI